MNKVLKNAIADIKFTLKRLADSQIAQEQPDSFTLLEKALELMQQAEDCAQSGLSFMEVPHASYSIADSIVNIDYRFQLSEG